MKSMTRIRARSRPGARNAAGWEMCLGNLDLLLEGAAVAKFVVDVWREKFRRYVKKLEPDAGPQQGMPENHPAADQAGGDGAERPRA